MEKVRLGRTEIWASRSGFGALPIQRIGVEAAVGLLRRAYEAGINFYDTAAAYTDSEEKIGRAFAGIPRESYFLATKTPKFSYDGVWEVLRQSLLRLRTDHIDVFQFHNPDEVPLGDSDGYRAMAEARDKGLIRFIGITAHKYHNAEKALRCGLYDTLQYPLSALSSEEELGLIELAAKKDVGVIAMKALCGGLLTSALPSMAVLRRYDNAVPIWGFQRPEELEEVIALEKDPPELSGEVLRRIEKDRRELAGDFCRGCGYCLPCAVGLPLNNLARLPQLIRRSPPEGWMAPAWAEQVGRVDECIDCGVCATRCPYHLNVPEKIRLAKEDYFAFKAEWEAERR